MARPSLPTLTWETTTVTSIAACTRQDFLDAVRNLLTTTTYWEDKNGGTPTDPTSNPYAYIEIGPVGGSTTENQRVTIAFEGTSALSGTSMAPYNEAATQLASPAPECLVANYQPEGGEVGFAGVDQFDPYGGRRSLGWTPCSPNGTPIFDVGTLINVWIIESNEIFVLCIEDDTNNREYGFIVGPMWIGASTANGDVDNNAPVGDRIWGAQYWSLDWGDKGWGQNNNSTDNIAGTRQDSNSLDSNRCYCFDPVTNDKGLQLGKTPYMAFNDVGGGTVNPIEQLTAHSGAYIGLDVNFAAFRGLGMVMPQFRYLGTWRQIRAGRSFPSRVVIDSGGSDVAIVRGGSPTLNHDALWFTNS